MTEGGKLEATEALAISAASTALGFPLPPSVAANALRSLNAVVAAGADVGVAWLQAKAQEIRSGARARESFAQAAVPVAVEIMSEDPELARRATMFLGNRMLREQRTREQIAAYVVEDLKADPPKDEAAPINEDWLDMFTRVAETKSNEDVKVYFARVLAGEIRKPSSFSPATLEVLARLTADVGVLFQRFCCLTTEIPGAPGSCCLLLGPFANPGMNGLEPVGFPYMAICLLQDAGLVRHELDESYSWPTVVLQRLRVGGKEVRFEIPALDLVASAEDVKKVAMTRRQMKALTLTPAGQQLRAIVHLTPNDLYIQRLSEWFVVSEGLRIPKGEDTPAPAEPAPAPSAPES